MAFIDSLIARLPLRSKFFLGCLAMLVPILALLYIAARLELTSISAARRENLGLQWATELISVGTNLAEYRDHAIAVAGGDDSERAEMLEHQGEIVKAADRLDQLATQGHEDLLKASAWKELGPRVREAVTGDPTDARHLRSGPPLIADVHQQVQAVADLSGLILDPGADTFPLMFSSLFDIPRGVEALASARRQLVLVAGGDDSLSTQATLAQEVAEARLRLGSAMHYLVDGYGQNRTIESRIPDEATGMRERLDAILASIDAGAADGVDAAEAARMSQGIEALTEDLSALRLSANQELSRLLDDRVRNSYWTLIREMLLVVGFLALAVWVLLRVTRYIGRQLDTANEVFGNLKHGRFDQQIPAQPGDELGALLDSLRDMQTTLATRVESDRQNIEAERVRAEASERIRSALDNVSGNVMVADKQNHIIYMNDAVTKMFRDAEGDIRRELPAFEVARLMGSNIDVFHRAPAHQQKLFAELRNTHTSELRVGGRTFRIIANPVLDASGQRLGTVVEWLERTLEVAAEQEIGQLVTAVADGRLDQRIALAGKSGFFEVLARGLNGVVGTVAEVVAELRQLVQSANEGDLTRRMELANKPGLYVSIGSGVNSLVGNMANVVAEVKHMATQVQTGAEEISKGNLDLSQRTEEQASSLEETASSMEQMTSTVRQTADNAGQANQLALAARQQAEKGGSVVSAAITAMSGINESSRKIADIIGVIDEIAFQTNLLALNAAVEAARAGEQGRGFAVVATEVRNLAGRSATAAKEIKSLIQDSVGRVADGSRLVDESGRTLEEIVLAVKKVADIVAEIAAASREQSAGIDQVNKAVMQMDTATQQNAALVEQAAAASRAIVEQTHSLYTLVERYRVAASAAGRALATDEHVAHQQPAAA